MNAMAQHQNVSGNFETKLAHARALLRQAALEHAPEQVGGPSHVSQASSLGAEDMVISHLINRMALDIGIFVLDTGRLHQQTLQLLEQLKTNSRAPVEVFKPVAESVVRFVARNGQDAMYKSIALRKTCCQIRKTEPLERALKGKTAWITGLRREQSGGRADVPAVDRSDAKRVKFNPLADWTWGDVWHYLLTFAVDYNPLHDQFYPSIGCEPCTRGITPGEDFRAGRWWWESEELKECGLHVKPHSAPQGADAWRSDAPEGFASAQADSSAAEIRCLPEPGRSHDEIAKECGLHVRPKALEQRLPV